MDEPPAALLSLTRFFPGGEPSRDVSRKRRWFSLVCGAVLVALVALLVLFPGGREDIPGPFVAPMEIVLGLMAAAQGAAGLLWEERRGISLWLSALGSMLYVSFVILGGALVYAWVGVLGAVAWAVLVVAELARKAARRRQARG